MTKAEVLAFLAGYKKGHFVSVKWDRPMTDRDLKAATVKAGIVVRKVVKLTLKLDINYYNTKTMREKLAELAARGEEYAPQKQPWFVRTQDAGIVAHKDDPNRLYLEIFPVDQPASECYYVVNGEVKTTAQVREMGLMKPSYWTKQDSGVATVKLADLVSIKYTPAR